MLAIETRPERTVRCVKCKRPVRSAASKKRRYGSGCWRYVNAAARVLESTGDAKAIRAAEALRDAAAVPTARRNVYLFVSSDGLSTYLVHPNADNCKAGLHAMYCYHKITVSVLSGVWGFVK